MSNRVHVAGFVAVALIGVAAVFALAFASGALAADRVVNVLNWTNYIDDTAIPAFEKKTGIKVNYDLMDSNEVLEGKLLAGNSGYDVVVPSGPFLGPQIKAGLYQPIDRAKLKNYGNLDPALLKQVEAFDPGNRYGVPYMWGTSGIAFNEAAIKKRMPDAPITSWRMLFDPKVVARFADCGVTVLDAGDEVFESALIYLGRDANSESAEDLEAAVGVIKAIQPYVRYFQSTSYIDDLANGEICLAMGWSGDVFQAQQNERKGVEIRYEIPKEGGIVWFDSMAIPKDAPHVDGAYAWIDNILDPEVVARISNAMHYANANLAARKLLDPSIGDNPWIFPGPDVMQRLISIKPNTLHYVRVRNRAWAQAKAGR